MRAYREIEGTVIRTNPETDMKPTPVQYWIPYADRMRVIDALNYIREHIGSSLGFRWSCRYYTKRTQLPLGHSSGFEAQLSAGATPAVCAPSMTRPTPLM